MQKFFFFLVFMTAILSAYGQTDGSKSSRLYLKIGANNVFFQNARFSNTVYSGIGGQFGIGFERYNPNNRWQLGLFNIGGGTTTNKHTWGSGLRINAIAYFKYLKKISTKLEVGGNWDILDFNLFSSKILINNGAYLLMSSNLYGSTVYTFHNKNGRKLSVGIDLGVFSFKRENMGFAFKVPQKVLEEGAFELQSEALDDPFSLKHGSFHTLNEFLNIKTNLTYRTKGRSEFAYTWNLRSIRDIKDYPLSIASHNLTYRIDLIYTNRNAK